VRTDRAITHSGGESYKDAEIDLTPHTWLVLQVGDHNICGKTDRNIYYDIDKFNTWLVYTRFSMFCFFSIIFFVFFN